MNLADEWSPAPPDPERPELTVAVMNHALVPESRRRGFCLCLHPMMQLINFSGLTCKWCLQPVTDEALSPAAKTARTNAIKTAYPWAVKEDSST